MQWIEEYEIEYGVEIRSAWMVSAAALTRRAGKPPLITYNRALSPQQQKLAATMLAGVLLLGWPGLHFRFRFPLPDDTREQRQASQRSRRDYRKAERWARERLLAPLMAQAERERWPVWVLADASGLDEDTCWAYVEERRTRIVVLRPPSLYVDMDGPIPF